MGFAAEISKWVQDKCIGNSNLLVRSVLISTIDSLVEKSPVGNPDLWKANEGEMEKKKKDRNLKKPAGYVGGTFRANWQLGIGALPSGTKDIQDKSGRTTKAKLKAGIPKEAAGPVYFITNNLPYAQALEDGHSTQAPTGIVSLTEVEFQGYVQKALAELK